ncbi:MAG: response regulator transcription factor [Thiohalomonadales bacterium]|nr:response regulator transcription factor [Thiohalomonadales bacterium]
MQTPPIVHIVDDDRAIRDSLKFLMKSVGFESQTYESAETFLDQADFDRPGCLVVDIRMQGMSGLELQQVLNERSIHLPVIVITGHGDIPMAVQAMKAGAIDFLEKPFDNEFLVMRIRQCLKEATKKQDKESKTAKAKAQLAQLTPREVEVMNLLVAGKHNKVIANELNISVRTAEAHRAKVMKKLQADSLSDIVRVALMQTV